MRGLPLFVLLAGILGAGTVQAQALRWGSSDAAGRGAWQAVLQQMPDLAADARATGFDPRRGLRQIAADLDGDGRAELFLSPRLDAWCGSAGCVVFVLRRAAADGWALLCQTYAQYGVREGDIRLLPRGAAGLRDFDATNRVRWLRQGAGEPRCEEEDRPRRLRQ